MIRKRVRIKICVFILCIAICLTSCNKAEKSKAMAYEFYYLQDYWNVLPMENTYFKTQEILEQTVLQYIEEIEVLLGISAWWVESAPNAENIGFNVQISKSGKSYAYKLMETSATQTEATLILNPGNGKDANAAHELTHIMIDREFTFSRSLEEGLCNYVQSQVGTFPDLGKNNWDIHEFLKGMITIVEEGYGFTEADSEKVINVVGNDLNGYPFGTSTPEEEVWYLYSQAYVTYLIHAYGMDDVINLIKEGVDETSYEIYLGKSYKEVKSEWITFYNNLECSIASEDIIQAFAECNKRE